MLHVSTHAVLGLLRFYGRFAGPHGEERQDAHGQSGGGSAVLAALDHHRHPHPEQAPARRIASPVIL